MPTGAQWNPGKMKQVVLRQYGSIDIDLARGEMAAATTINQLVKELWNIINQIAPVERIQQRVLKMVPASAQAITPWFGTLKMPDPSYVREFFVEALQSLN